MSHRILSVLPFWAVFAGLLAGPAANEPSLAQARLGAPAGDDTPAQAPLGPPKKMPVSLALPAPDDLFRLESEIQWRERLVREYVEQGQKKVYFPPDARVAFVGKQSSFPPTSAVLEPTGLCLRPLYFEQPLVERAGVYCPLAQPLISTSLFYWDTFWLPIQMIFEPPWTRTCQDNGP